MAGGGWTGEREWRACLHSFVHSFIRSFVHSFFHPSFFHPSLVQGDVNAPSVANRTMPEMNMPLPMTVSATAITTLHCLSEGIRLHSDASLSMVVLTEISRPPILVRWRVLLVGKRVGLERSFTGLTRASRVEYAWTTGVLRGVYEPFKYFLFVPGVESARVTIATLRS